MLVKVAKLTLNKPKAVILISFLVFSMKIITICFNLLLPFAHSEWNKLSPSNFEAIERSLPK